MRRKASTAAFAAADREELENEVLIVLIPRILRLPEITAANLTA